MAGWPIQADGSGDRDNEKRFPVQAHEDEEENIVLRRDDEDVMLRNLFEKVLSDLQIGFNAKNSNTRPIRAMLGNGQSVDLFKLFWLVKEGGGMDSVSIQHQWGSIGEKLGFNPKVSASLKLFYIKYFDILDQSLNRIFSDGSLSKSTSEYDGNLGLLALELEKRFKGLSNYQSERKMNVGYNGMSLGHSKISEQSDIALKESLQVPVDLGESINDLSDDVIKTPSGDRDDNNMVKIKDKEEGATPPCTSTVEQQTVSRKRKRGALDQVLKWMYRAAKNPCDPRIGKVPECSKWKENKRRESWLLAIAIRESLLKRKYPESDNICPSLEQKKQKVTPSMYDDSSVRCSSRFPVVVKSPVCCCFKGSTHKQCKLGEAGSTHKQCKLSQLNDSDCIHHQKIKEINHLRSAKKIKEIDHLQSAEKIKEIDQLQSAIMVPRLAIIEPPQIPVDIKLSPFEPPQMPVDINLSPLEPPQIPADIKLSPFEPPQIPVDIKLSPFEQQYNRKRVRVNVGPRYQAEILSGTRQTAESDSRWLGTLVWPPNRNCGEEESRRPLALVEEPVGKVCHSTCDCQFPSSVECVRFHVAEKRLKLKLELGRAFYQWKFHTMGEIVSLSWSPKEEEKFKEVMTSSPMLLRGKSTFLLKKTRKDLVDYYFNVFLQRKRCYQNRTTPKEVDSDDELSDFGSVGGLYGDVAIRVSGLNPRVCTLNEQCWDFLDKEVS